VIGEMTCSAGRMRKKTDDLTYRLLHDWSLLDDLPAIPEIIGKPANAFTRAGLAHLTRGTVYTRLSRRGFDYFDDAKWRESVEEIGSTARRGSAFGPEGS
jgi:hypothetical protein